MTTAVVLLAVAAVLVAAAVGAPALRKRRTSPSSNGPDDDDWMARAGAVAEDGFLLADRIEALGGSGRLSRLPDDAVAEIVSDMGDYGGRVATLSAAAPTVMDARVCRNLGVQARIVRSLFEDELRSRAQLNGERVDVGSNGRNAAGSGLDELRVAAGDLRDHVDLF